MKTENSIDFRNHCLNILNVETEKIIANFQEKDVNISWPRLMISNTSRVHCFKTNIVLQTSKSVVSQIVDHHFKYQLNTNSNMTSFFRFVDKRAIYRWYNLIRTCAGECDWLFRRKCTCWWIIVCSNLTA